MRRNPRLREIKAARLFQLVLRHRQRPNTHDTGECRCPKPTRKADHANGDGVIETDRLYASGVGMLARRSLIPPTKGAGSAATVYAAQHNVTARTSPETNADVSLPAAS